MAHIRKLPSGKYQAAVRTPSGAKVTRTDPLRRVVADWAKDEEVRIARGQWRDPRIVKVTFEAWRDRWVAARVVEGETRRRNESQMRLYLTPHWQGWLLTQITRMDVQAWVRGMQKDGAGAPTVRQAYHLLATMLADAVLEGAIPASPCHRVTLPAAPPKAPVWFTPDQVTALVRCLPERHGIATRLMVWTGLRWGEMAGLRIGDIDWLRRRITVVGALGQDGVWKEYPKTSKSRREIPVPAHVLELLAPLVQDRAGDELLFTTAGALVASRGGRARGGRPWSGPNWRKVWDAAVTAAKVPAYTPHACRHTAASWLVQDGVQIYNVQRLLGHESINTTMKYAHLAPDVHEDVEEAWQRRLAAHQRTSPRAPGKTLVAHQRRTRVPKPARASR